MEGAAFRAPPGRSIEEYEQLIRFSIDVGCVYVIVHRDDLADGRLDRAVATPSSC